MDVLRLAGISSQLHHIGIVVNDLSGAIRFYESLGIGPFKMGRWQSLAKRARLKMHVFDKSVPVNAISNTVAHADVQPMRFELIQPEGDPSWSLWLRFLQAKGQGIQHLAFSVDDLDKAKIELSKNGIRPVYEVRYEDGLGGAYFETADNYGHYLELVQVQ